MPTFIKKRDAVIISVIIVAALSLLFVTFLLRTRGAECEIIKIGGERMTVSLGENREFSVFGEENVIIEIKEGAVRFKQSDCPDKICERAGFIKYVGESATCLPNRLMIRIISGSGPEVDAVAK